MTTKAIWELTFSKDARKDLKKLDKGIQKRLINYLKTRILTLEDPRQLGKSLAHNMNHIWRYRVGDYRILCEIIDQKLIVDVVQTGHRKVIYDAH